MAKRIKKITGLPDEAEAAMDDVVQRCAEHVEYLLEILMPDGRPFGTTPKPIDQQLAEYINGGYRDNPEACKNKIRALVGQITNTLYSFGVPPEQMAQVMPYDLAETVALIWSARMESLLKEREAAQLVAPSADVESAGATTRRPYAA